MTDLTLYHAIPSRGLIVHWLLEELGQPYDLKILDLEKDEHKTEEYLAVNPMGKVPALLHGDTLITETAAICLYLAETFPEAGLSIPVGSALRGEYLRWMFFGPVTVEPAILWKAFAKPASADDYEPFSDPDAVASTLSAVLADREYIVGDSFTAADVIIGSSIMWGLKMMPVLPALPELTDYWSGLESRPAWQRVQATLPVN